VNNYKNLISRLRIYWLFMRDYKYKAFILFSLLFINMILSSVEITLLLPIINFLIGQEPSNLKIIRYIFKFFEFINIKPNLISIFSFFMVLVVIKSIINYIESIIRSKIQRDMTFSVGSKIFDNLMKVSYSFFHNTKKGDIYYYISGAACYLKFTLFHILEVIFDVFLIFGYSCILFSISTKLTIIIFLLGFFSIVIYKNLFLKTRKLTKDQTQLNQKFNSAFIDSIDGIKIVKSFNREEFEKKKFRENWFSYLNVLYKSYKNSAIISSLTNPISFLLIILLILYIHYILKFDFAVMSVYMLIIYKLIPLFQRIPITFNSLITTLAPVDIALEAVSETNKPYLKNGEKSITEFKKNIIFKNVSFKYINEYVLHNINLEISKNQTTAIIGATGSGKSTMIDLLLRLYDVTQGEILIDDVNIKNIRIEDWRNICAIVQQDVFLFNDTIKNNILYGKLDATEEEVIEAAKKANAYNFIMELPDKFETFVGERGVKLSGGQKQMIALARAIIRQPQILILDEATSSLDNQSERNIQKALDYWQGKMTIIVIAHRLSTILNADKIIVLDKGQIVETGTHSDLIDKNSFYSRYYNLQFKLEVNNSNDKECYKNIFQKQIY